MRSKNHRVRRVDRLLAPAAAELLDREGLVVSIELAAEGDHAEERIARTMEMLAPAPAAYLRLQHLAALGALDASVTHETRNSLTAILGFVQIARERTDDPDRSRRHLELIERETQRCIEILERFLSLAQPDAAEPESIEVGPIVDHVVNATRHAMSMRRIKMIAELDRDLPYVRCHRGELTQVVLNLLINAMHATPAEGSVVVSASRAGMGLEIVVADTGAGIAPELVERIFEPFFTTKPAGQGTGLGLALCRRIVSTAGGTLEVDSSPGHGARFRVQLPGAE